MKRRSFVGKTLVGGFAALIAPKVLSPNENWSFSKIHTPPKGLVSICTWSFTSANAAAAKALESGSDALTAAIKVAEVEELNAQNTTVGLRGAPDREGTVTLDASVIDHTENCGSVVAVENIVHVAALARDVMEKTPHVILAWKGAESYAKSLGYKHTDLLTTKSKKEWEEWAKESQYKPIINIENHDTMMTGYFISAIGIEELGYAGNSPNVWDGVPQEVSDDHGLAYDLEWVAKCIDQEKRNEIAQWDDEGRLIS